MLAEHRWVAALALLFAVVYSLISLVGHYHFRTSAYDSGIFSQALYHYSHLSLGPVSLRDVSVLLADHFELLLFAFAPLYWLFGTYTLLLIQIAAIIAGGLGVYALVRYESKDTALAVGAATAMWLFYGIYSALSFDAHMNVIGIMLLPWLILAFVSGRIRAYYVLLALLLLAKENLGLIGVFLGVSLYFTGPKPLRKHALITSAVSALYFMFVIKLLIPAFNHNPYAHWEYTKLGGGPAAAIWHIVTNPIHTLKLLFDGGDKVFTFKLLAASGGLLALLAPRYVILLVPVLAQKLLADQPLFWGYVFHYSAELAPLVALGAAATLAKFKPRWRYGLLGLVILGNLFVLAYKIPLTKPLKIFQPVWYRTPYDRAAVMEAIRRIPKDARVSAENAIAVRLVDRKTVYLLPAVRDAEYVILNEKDPNYSPFGSQAEVGELRQKFSNDPAWETVYDNKSVYVFKKR